MFLKCNMQPIMPQPLSSKLSSNPHLQFHFTGGFANRQELAVYFARAMAEFGVCEGQLGRLYLILNKDKPDEAFRDLEKNVTYSSRIMMVESSLYCLNREDQALGLSVLHRAKTASKMRNRIAHCTWGFSEQLPDIVLRVPTAPKDIRERLKEMLGLSFQREAAEIGIFCYVAKDFEDIEKAAIDAAAPLSVFSNYLMSNKPESLKQMILSDSNTEGQFNKYLGELTQTQDCWLTRLARRIRKF